MLSKNEQNPSDFVFYDINEDRYSANTLLLNRFCTTLNENIAAYLSQFPSENISIPFGAVFDASLIADNGPDISFTIYPAGNVITNYDSEFISAGINQVNYKIWLDISIELQIVNPFYKEDLKLIRKVLLADIIFNGKVPDHYFQMNSPDEYLLTE
jgi:sporulation protein YunB